MSNCKNGVCSFDAQDYHLARAKSLLRETWRTKELDDAIKFHLNKYKGKIPTDVHYLLQDWNRRELCA